MNVINWTREIKPHIEKSNLIEKNSDNEEWFVTKEHLNGMLSKICNMDYELIVLDGYRKNALRDLEKGRILLNDYFLHDKKYLKLITKIHRWIGWVQGVLNGTKNSTLEEMKLINKNS